MEDDGRFREVLPVERQICDHGKLVNAIVAGVPAEQVEDRMIILDARRTDLQRQLDRIRAEDPVRYHPSMARTYRIRVGALIRGLGDAGGMEEAKEAVLTLVERIVLTPALDDDPPTIGLQGAIAALLRLATRRALQRCVRQTRRRPRAGATRPLIV